MASRLGKIFPGSKSDNSVTEFAPSQKHITPLEVVPKSSELPVNSLTHAQFEENVLEIYKTTIDYDLWNVRGYPYKSKLLVDLFIPNSGNTLLDRAKRWWDETCYIKYSGKLERFNIFIIILSFGILIATLYWLYTTERVQTLVSMKHFDLPSDAELKRRATLPEDEQIKIRLEEADARLAMIKSDKEFNMKPIIMTMQSIRTICMIIPSLIICWEVFKRTTNHHKSITDTHKTIISPRPSHVSERARTVLALSRLNTGFSGPINVFD